MGKIFYIIILTKKNIFFVKNASEDIRHTLYSKNPLNQVTSTLTIALRNASPGEKLGLRLGVENTKI